MENENNGMYTDRGSHDDALYKSTVTFTLLQFVYILILTIILYPEILIHRIQLSHSVSLFHYESVTQVLFVLLYSFVFWDY